MALRGLAVLVLGAIFAAGCRRSGITQSGGELSFTCPSAPGDLSQQDQNVTLDFGEVPLGQTVTLTVELTSLGGSAITVSSVTAVQSDAAFAFPLSSGIAVQVSPPMVVLASFAPSQAGTQSASWSIGLGGSGGSGSGQDIHLTLTGNGFPVSLSVDPDPVDFGEVEVHAQASKAITVTNSSPQTVDLGLNPPDGGPFSLGPIPASLGAGASLTLKAYYSPVQVGVDRASFSLAGCPGCGPAVVVPLLGVGVTSNLAYPNPLPFGFVPPRTSIQKTLTLQNVGPTSLQILTRPTLDPGSAVPPPGAPAVFAFAAGQPNVAYPYTLNPGQQLSFPISFTPPASGVYLDGTVSFQSSDPNASQVIVALQGYGGGAQISCQPATVDLGPVAVGFSASQNLICTNVGTDIPDYPQGALQLNQSLLSTTNPPFAATLQGDADGGSSISLTAGQSATLQVSFNPPAAVDAGPQSGLLQVGSNDLNHDPLSIPLVARAVSVGPCTAEILPPEGLNFGEVPVGSSVSLQFAVQNQGNNYCILKNLKLAAGSDPAFSLPDGGLSYQLLSFPGDPYNTTNLPTEFRQYVSFDPTQSEAAATGTVNLEISNANPASRTVALTGSSAPSCLSFVPTRVDFGLVGFDEAKSALCFGPHQAVTVQNNCLQPVTVQDISLLPGLDATAQFALSGLPSFPTTISAGGQLEFTASFTATQTGPTVETIQVRSSAAVLPIGVSLSGNAGATGDRTDSFVVPEKQVDLVLLLDVDDDCGGINRWVPEVDFVAQLPTLLAQLTDGHIDYRIAVMDDGIVSGWDQGAFLPCAHCLVSNKDEASYITAQSQPDPSTALTQLVSAVWNSSSVNCKAASGVADEQLFKGLSEALEPSLLAGHNRGFLRDGAYLSILGVNADGEDDYSGISPNQMVNLLETTKQGNRGLASWSFYDSGIAGDGDTNVYQLAAATGELLIDEATNGWEKILAGLFASTVGLGTFALGAEPDPSTLVVQVDGVSLPAQSTAGALNWSYDPTTNTVVFATSVLPTPESTISITYSLACP